MRLEKSIRFSKSFGKLIEVLLLQIPALLTKKQRWNFFGSGKDKIYLNEQLIISLAESETECKAISWV